MQYKTLGELRSTLITRLGFGAAGAAAGVITANVDSFLFNAQVQLYWQFDWKKLEYRHDKTMGVGQSLYDYPTVAGGATADAHDERILRVEVNLAISGNPRWVELKEGISIDHRNALVNNSAPCRYERYAQLEVLPAPDQAYTLRVWYTRALGQFTMDNDRATIDDNLIFLHALSNAKAHYKQTDAQFYSSQLDALLMKMKSKGFGRRNFKRTNDDDVLPRPVVI